MDNDNLTLPATEINEKLISSFIKTTSSLREEAKSFLETHQWDLDAAVSAFTEINVADAAAESNVINPSDAQLFPTVAARNRYSNLRISIPVSSHSPSNSSDFYIPSPSRLWLRSTSQSNPSRDRNPFSSKRAADKPCASQRIKRRQLTGNKLKLAEISGGNNDSDSDDNHGGEQSGTTIMQEPEEGEDVDDKDKESDVERTVQSSSRPTFGIVSAEPQVVVTFIVTIWRNGFTVDDGPLKTLDNPEDATFVEIVQRLESPRDLNPEDNQVRRRIKLIRRQEEDFNESPEPNTLTPFQCIGATLSRSDSAATEPPASSDSLTTTPPPSMSLVVDPAAPITSIKLRLADGTRIFSRFNTHHTVRDVRGFIDASRPGGSNDYKLLMGFPPKPLLDFDQTIEKAGISNSVLIQKY